MEGRRGRGRPRLVPLSPADAPPADAPSVDPPAPAASSMAQRVAAFEAAVTSPEFYERVFTAVLNRVYPGDNAREHGHERRLAALYGRIRSKVATESEQEEWHWSATRTAAEKLCSIVNYLLTCGPLSASESELLERAVGLLVLYYREKIEVLSKVRCPASLFQKFICLPPSNTPSEEILKKDPAFIAVMELCGENRR